MISLVIPVADEPHNATLELALHSALVHAPQLIPVLVGNPLTLEQYLRPFPEGLVLPFLQQDPGDPVGNTTRMLKAAVESWMVSDPFVWSNDDIFFRAPISLEALVAVGTTARGKLTDHPDKGRHGRLARKTARRLVELKAPVYDYEGHVPMVVERTEMSRALGRAPGCLPRSVYQNLLRNEPTAVKPDVKVFTVSDLAQQRSPEEQPFISTGNRFPVEEIERFLDF